jgi:hypothetical protein
MRKTIAAVTVGLLLVAGQAAATNNAAAARVGDRVGARAGAASDFQAPALAPFIVFGQTTTLLIFGTIVVVAAGSVVSTDGCTSGCS